MEESIYFGALIICTILSFALSINVFRRKESSGSFPFALMMAGIAVWTFFQIVVLYERDFQTKIIISNLRYFGIEIVPLAFYALAREYENRLKPFGKKEWAITLIIPFICTLFLWTNPLHDLFYSKTSILNGFLVLENGIFFWINMIYLYSFILAGMYVFIKASMLTTRIYRMQAILVLISAVFPFIANVLFNFNIINFNNLDLTPFAFVLTGFLLFLALFNMKLLEIVPVARETLVEEMDDLVIVLDNSKRILDLNKSARKLILENNDENYHYLGKEIVTSFSKWTELTEFIKNPAGKKDKVTFSALDGFKCYHIIINSILNKKGKKTGEIIVLRDITVLETAIQIAEKNKLEAENANRAKDFFLANMSHEIRTPLNAVIGMAEILDTGELEKEKQGYYTNMILKSAISLLEILNDVLDFSKIEAGKMELEMTPFNLKALANEMVETFSITAAGKSIFMKAEIDNEVEEILIGDYTRVRQILVNLIGNAIKFTHEGTVAVGVKKIKNADKKSYVEIYIKDSGIGIAEESLAKIFESFRQADNSTTRKYGGSGLGLSIVKNLVELMNGELMLTSKVSEGSTFRCIIPFDIPESHIEDICVKGTVCREKSEIDSQKLNGIKVLVAEDNKVNREIVGINLKKLNCIFEFAENGVEACEKFYSSKYDIVLMDIMMPEMDGLQATKEIRLYEKKINAIKNTPIIALTAGATQEDVEKCISAGMTDHLSKPIRMMALYDMLVKHS